MTDKTLLIFIVVVLIKIKHDLKFYVTTSAIIHLLTSSKMFNAVLFTIVVLVIYCIRRKYSYWERKGVPGPKAWPFFGNIFYSFTQKKTVGQIFREIYR